LQAKRVTGQRTYKLSKEKITCHLTTIFALGLKGLGENTKLGGSMLVMAIVGGAFFPLVLGAIARSTGSMALGYVVPLVCFGGVALYGFAAPWILPKPGNTDPEAGLLAAEYGQGF
jgi:hypothetical protein